MATGAGIYLRHTWGTTVPAYFSNPQLNTTAYAWTYVYSPKAQTAGALIEFQNYGRSENDKAPDAGNWDRKGSRIYLNDEEIMPPTWTNSGKSIGAEVDLQNENFPARQPVSVQLKEGWNKVLLKLPYVSANGVRLNKWMFTFVLTTPDGKKALEDIVYSPTQTKNPEEELTLTAPEGYTLFDIADVQAKSTFFTISSTNASKYLAIINFTVMLAPEDEVHITAPTPPATHAAYYTLAGQRIASPKQTGIYIKGSRKVVV